MKLKILFLVTVVIVLLTSACGKATPTPIAPSADEIFKSVYTMAAQTSAAQQTILTPRPTATPTIAVPTITPFVPTATLLPPSVAAVNYIPYSVCDDSMLISDVTVSDDTEFAPGETFTKTWRIQNTGTCVWNKHYTITFSDGNRMSGETTTIDQSVDPNEIVDISVELTAPDEEGTYTGYWILTNKDEIVFGNYFYVRIAVSGEAATSTATATIEATATPTSASTSTAVSTDTPTPVVIGTPTPTQIEMPTLIK